MREYSVAELDSSESGVSEPDWKDAVFCTVVTAPFLQQALTLASSLRAVHPQSTLVVLLADSILPAEFARRRDEYLPRGIKLVALDELACEAALLERMTFWYSPFELCCALRGLLHEYLWRATSAAQWIFLDSDIFALAPLDDIFEQLQNATLIVTPHRRKALGSFYASGLERDLLRGGICNAGFVGVRRCEETASFISWFCARLERCALDDPFARGWFVDQLWLNLALHSFQNVQVARALGANVGHWNLFDARFEYSPQAGFEIEGEPLLCFHFSGWNQNAPEQLSKHLQPGQELPASHQSAWLELSSRYRDALSTHADAALPRACAFSRFENGAPITPWMRRHFYDLSARETLSFSGSPFLQAEYFARAERELCNPPLWKRAARRLKKS